MFCPRCHHEINEDDKFCSHCGLEIERCPTCHQPLLKGSKFCSHCGSSVSQHQEYMGGYYQPIQEDEYIVQEEKVDFHRVQTKRKVNKVVIIVSVTLLVVATVLSYFYLNKTSMPLVDKDVIQETKEFVVSGGISNVSYIGNSNQGGHVAKDKDLLYIVNDVGQLVSMDAKTQNQKVIIDDQVEYVNIANNQIYYTNKDHHICSSDFNGQNQKVLVNMKAYYMLVVGQKIYYQSDTDEEKIYVYDLQNNQNTRLNNRHSYNLNVIDQDIYYTSTDGIYRMDIDGKGEEKLVNGEFYNLLYHNQKLYYSESSGGIKSYDIRSKSILDVIDSVSQIVNMNDQYIFYYTREGLNRYCIETKESIRIDSQIPSYCEVLGDKLILTFEASRNGLHRVIMELDGKNPQRLFYSQQGDFV